MHTATQLTASFDGILQCAESFKSNRLKIKTYFEWNLNRLKIVRNTWDIFDVGDIIIYQQTKRCVLGK